MKANDTLDRLIYGDGSATCTMCGQHKELALIRFVPGEALAVYHQGRLVPMPKVGICFDCFEKHNEKILKRAVP